MRNLSDTTRSNNFSETSGEDGDVADAFTGKTDQIIIDKANSILITKVFSLYNVRLDSNNRKTICPFPSHKGGRERTASFMYYPHTNTYWCFGCSSGRTPCDFVSNMDHIDRLSSAQKILEAFNGENSLDDFLVSREDYSKRLDIMMKFSNSVREFRKNNISDDYFIFIEELCNTFDILCIRHKLDNTALEAAVDKLIRKINSYKSCLKF